MPPITEQHAMTPYQQDAFHPEGAGVYGGLVIGVVGPTGTETSTNRAGVAKLYAKPRFSKQIKISFDVLTFSI